MDDLISRQAAIDAFEIFIHELGIEDEPYNYGEMALSAKNVPPVKPQERTGHWNLFHTTEHGMREDSYFKCNRCNYESYKEYNFCPDCGARMIEPQERSK